MEMVVIVCELVVAVCTLVYLFSLQHSVDSGVDGVSQDRRRDVAYGFVSLALTLAVLVVMAIGVDKLVQCGQAVWTRFSTNLDSALPHRGTSKVPSVFENSVVGASTDAEDTEDEVKAISDGPSPTIVGVTESQAI